MNRCLVQRLLRMPLVLAVAGCLLGRADTLPISTDFIVRAWKSSDGVTTAVSRCAALAADGSLWVGTFDGAYRLAGDKSMRYVPEATPGYRSYWFVSLLSRRDGSLWGGTGEGLRRFEEGHWVPFPTSANPPPGMVEGLVESPAGEVYISISTNCFLWDGKVFSVFPTPYRRPGDTSPAHLVFDELGILWARTDSALARFEKGEWRTVLAPDAAKGFVRGICAAQRGGVWVAVDDRIMRYRGDDVDRVTPLPESIRGDWLQMHHDSHGNLWIGGFDKGLAVLETGSRWLGGSAKNDFPSEHVFCLAEDMEGNVYVGSNGQGFFQIRARRAFPLVPETVGPDGNPGFNAAVIAAPDIIVAGTSRGVCYEVSIPKRQAREVKTKLPQDEPINTLLVDRGGHLWAGSQNNGLWRSPTLHPEGLEKFASCTAPINALFEDHQHNLFVGTGQGVCLLRGSVLEPVSAGVGTNISVTCFAADNAGRIWMGSSAGLLQYQQGSLALADITPGGVFQPEVAALHVDRYDNLWAALRDGTLLVKRQDRWLALPKSDLQQTMGVNLLAEDGTGRLWVGSKFGLVAFPIREAIDFAEGKGPRPLVIQLTGKDDLAADDDFSSTGFPAWCLDERGSLWFANAAALTRVNPALLPVNRRTVDVVLSDILVGNRSYFSQKTADDAVHLPHGASPIVVKYSAPLFTMPERTLFEYRLDSRYAKWVSNGRNRELRFADLGSGRHQIEIRAVNADGVCREQGKVITLEVQPYLYETAWFRSAAGAAVLAVFVVIGRRGLRRYVKKREAHLNEREAAARAELKRVSLEADRMRLEARLQDAQRLEALGTLAGGIAHDFNNLLQSILGNAELGRLKADNPAETQEHFDEVAKAAERARVLVAQILLFSRREKPRRIPLLAGPVVKETLKMLRSGIPPIVDFDVSIPDELPPILGDPSAIQRIVANLGTNAAHAMRAHGGKLTVRLSVAEIDEATAQSLSLVSPGKYLCLTVADTGHGMDADTQRRAFEPFFTTKQPGEGTGLGLSVVQGLVQSLEGGIRLRSQQGAGSVFEIYLPVTQEKPAPTPALKTPAAIPGALRILVVDDDHSVLDFAIAAARQLGHSCEGYNLAERALGRFTSSPGYFDLVLTDLTMPGMDGREFAEAIHAVQPQMPVILASGYGEGMDEASAKASGFAALMSKPYTLETLAAVISRVMAGHAVIT